MTHTSPREALKSLIAEPGIALVNPPILIPPAPYFDLAGEEFGARLILTTGTDGSEFCLRPDFTLPIAMTHLQNGQATPAAYGYLGPIFRQREDGPAEFDQAGIELLAQPDPETALTQVIDFARAALDIHGVDRPSIRMGSIDLFEAFLSSCDMPDVWRPRIRARFGHPRAMTRLLYRLADPHKPDADQPQVPQDGIADWVGELMLTNGLSLTESRSPEEIARRYLEKQALEAAHVPSATLTLLRSYLAIKGEADHALEAIAKLCADGGLALDGALADCRARIGLFRNRGKLGGLVFDAGFSPRLDYYTGITFEMTGNRGAVLVSGGQYDRLLQRLGANAEVPAVGCALWVDRLDAEAQAGEANR